VLKQAVNIHEKEHKNPTQCPHVNEYSIQNSIGVYMLHVTQYLWANDFSFLFWRL